MNLKQTLSTATLGLSLVSVAQEAKAAIFTVNGTDYNIETVEGTFNDLSATLESQVWWGDSSLAEDFANVVAGSFPNNNENNGFEPFFVFTDFLFGNKRAWAYFEPDFSSSLALVNPNENHIYAVVAPVTQPVPEPLTILGAGAAIAFGGHFKRKLKKNSEKTV